ncbi:Indolepyruvate oxidoreductase subunit IorB [Candidatus Lokiarchaeum ossiferum]|uniref:Indolepyruvate oxidoreductase subunit IorB n=1 Tax=Candidatus Lokiarchaeum ossiferum TaxID=2951803 RepID=A0ABY6HZF7_9ARCH|nr:Indolepyruvate oxidoreductase subunit IorB [Candidatus Lokiarchaeum sp. B-35]
MEINHFNCLSIGVGGQGVIRATQILADAALLDKHSVRTAETHGMAQRGGSVTGYLRFGSEVMGPLIPKGGANIIMSFEPSEAIRAIPYANADTIMFVNIKPIIPLSVYQNKKIVYPSFEEMQTNLKKVTQKVLFIDAAELAIKAGSIKAANVIMLGVMLGSGALPLSRENLEKAIMDGVPAKALDINKKAFDLGIAKGEELKEKI